MKSYEKPIILETEEFSEGVYMASGDSAGSQTGSECQSSYMKGVFRRPKDWYQENDTMITRGCEGCPAAYSNTECRRNEKTYGDPLMPKWEALGKDPDSNYKY